jgi:hypothetical protein
LNEANDALACKKQGFFVAGFETPGQYRALHDEYIPLSRAICCRPCIMKEDVAAIAEITGDQNFTAKDVVAVSANCRGSVRGSSPGSPTARSDSGVAADGPTCPADTFLQGFAADVRANPSASSDDQYYYPTGTAQCCAPRLLLRSGKELLTERCECARQTSQYSVGCGAANTPESAQETGSLIYAFENEVRAMASDGTVVQVPVTPLSCCKVCVSPNAKPTTETCASLDFCNGRGECDSDGHCACDAGWSGDACESSAAARDDDAVKSTMVSATKIAFAFIAGGFLWFPAARVFGWGRRRGRPEGELEEELLGADQRGARANDWEFEASDLSTSDEEDVEDAERDAEGDAERGGDAGGDETEGEGKDDAERQCEGLGSERDGSAPAEEARDVVPDETSETEKPGVSAGLGKKKGFDRGFSSECNVCMSAPVQVVLIPCGHACLCRKCSRRMRRCPVCRTEVERRQKLYLATE